MEKPYIEEEVILKRTDRKYNPNYGDERVCKCGHTYGRHFDSYENMEACGCKYCSCYTFEEAVDKYNEDGTITIEGKRYKELLETEWMYKELDH